MCTTKKETWITEGGHMFVSSGHTTSSRGVAILIHKKWQKYVTKYQPINKRIAYIDIVRRSFKMRLATAYFPHSGYNDNHIQQIYDALATIHDEACNTCILQSGLTSMPE